MSKTIEIPGVAGQCPVCHHPPIRHVPDGTGITCLVCQLMAHEAINAVLAGSPYTIRIPKICTLKFEFKLSQREREQAMAASKDAHPARTICAECNCAWEAHAGWLCPTGDSTFMPLVETKLPFLHTQ